MLGLERELGPLLKRRSGRSNGRRICLEDAVLSETALVPSTPYKAIVDPVHRQVIILPATEEEGDRLPHVSHTHLKTMTKPVIDLRSRRILGAFETVVEGDEEVVYFQVSVYRYGVVLSQGGDLGEPEVIIEGYAPDSSKAAQERMAAARQKAMAAGRVTDITQLLAVKRMVTASIPLREFRDILAATGTEARRPSEIGSITISGIGYTATFHQPEFRLFTPLMEEYQEKARLALQAVSLFSGAGLMDLGAVLAGFQVVFALDIDRDACATYRHNFGNFVVQADIREFDLDRIPKATVMFGGPPCKGFSTLNPRRSPGYPTNSLVDYFIEAVRRNENCRVFVIENTPGFLTMDGGRFLERVKQGLKEFRITAGVLQAADFGSPQMRRRAVVIGSKIGEIPLPKPARAPAQYRTVRWALQGYHEGLPNASDYSESGPETKARIRAVPPGGNWRDLPEPLREGLNARTFSHKYRRLHPDRPAITIGNLNKCHVIAPDDEDHFLSVRQGARLFGVPDRFVFLGGLKSRMEQVGNGVAVHLSYHLFRHVREFLERWLMFEELGFQP